MGEYGSHVGWKFPKKLLSEPGAQWVYRSRIPHYLFSIQHQFWVCFLVTTLFCFFFFGNIILLNFCFACVMFLLLFFLFHDLDLELACACSRFD